MKRFAIALVLGLSFVGSADKFPGKVKISVDIGVQSDVQALDILFVVDDSASMQAHQEKMAKVGVLLTKLQAARVPFQIGIATTSPSRGSALRSAVLTPSTPDLANVLAQVLRVGVDGDPTESVFAPLKLILSDSRNGLALREDGKLALITITDADEQSTISEADIVAFLKGLKKNGLDDISAHSFLVDPAKCLSDGQVYPKALESFTKQLKGSVYDLCEADQSTNLDLVATRLLASLETGRGSGAAITEVPLTTEPVVDSIRVTYGAQVLRAGDFRRGWVYDSQSKSILLGKDIQWSVQPGGTQLEVTFVPADWQN